MQHVDIGVFIHLRGIQQLHRHLHRALDLDLFAVFHDGDVKGLGVGQLAAGDVQRLGGLGSVCARYISLKFGYSQPRTLRNAGLPVIFKFNVKSIAGGVQIEGADCVCNHIH